MSQFPSRVYSGNRGSYRESAHSRTTFCWYGGTWSMAWGWGVLGVFSEQLCAFIDEFD